MPGKTVVSTDKAPGPLGGAPYSQAVVAGGFIFTAGQVAARPDGSGLAGDTISEQTEQVMANLKAILEAAGSGLDQIVKTTVFMKTLDDFPAMNEVYRRHVGTSPPARSTIAVAGLPAGALVEIEAVATVG